MARICKKIYLLRNSIFSGDCLTVYDEADENFACDLAYTHIEVADKTLTCLLVIGGEAMIIKHRNYFRGEGGERRI